MWAYETPRRVTVKLSGSASDRDDGIKHEFIAAKFGHGHPDETTLRWLTADGQEQFYPRDQVRWWRTSPVDGP